MHHVDGGEQNDREQDIHRGPGNGDQEAVPARVIHELARIVRALVHGILAAHFYVAAERDCVYAIVGLALAETHKPFAESDGELLHADAQPLGHHIVAKLVN